MNWQSKLRWTLLILFSALFLVSAGMVLRLIVQGAQEQRAFESLAVLVETGQPAESSAPPADGAQEPSAQEPPADGEADASSPYLALKEQNPDFYGWLTVEGTRIDYPVMYTPDDPERYLNHAFDGSSAYSGVPFRDAHCVDGGLNDLIHGHNMNNGTMFHDLLEYADEDFFKEHPVIRLDTLEGEGRYEVMAAFYSQVYEQDAQGVFRYYQYVDLSDPARYEAYVEQVLAAALYDTGVTARYGDALVTLSTCSYQTDNGRFVVVARKQQD